MPFRGPDGRPLPFRRRRPIVPVAVDRAVREQPIAPRPRPTPQRTPTPTEIYSEEESRAYGRTQTSLMRALQERRNEMQARWLETQAQKESNEIREEVVAAEQDKQLERTIDGFSPRKASAHYLQGAAFRPDIPIDRMEEEARHAEGVANLRKWHKWWENASPFERASMGPMAAAMGKEGLDAEEYRDIVDDAKAGRYDASKDRRRAAQRVLDTTLTGVNAYPEDIKRAEPYIPKLVPEDDPNKWNVGQIARGFRRGGAAALRGTADIGEVAAKVLDPQYIPTVVTEAGEAGLEAIGQAVQGDLEGVRRELQEAGEEIPAVEDLQQGWRGVEHFFEAEQEIVTPFTRPLFHRTLTTFGVPEDAASSIAKYAAEVFVPSSAYPISRVGLLGRGLSKGRILSTLLAEGMVNVLQNRAGHKTRGEPPPSRSEDLQMLVYGAGGRGTLEVAGKLAGPAIRTGAGAAGRRVSGLIPGAQRAGRFLMSEAGEFRVGKFAELSKGRTYVSGKIEGVSIALSAEAGAAGPINLSMSRIPGRKSRTVMAKVGAFIEDLQAKNPTRPIEVDAVHPAVVPIMKRLGATEVARGKMRLPPRAEAPEAAPRAARQPPVGEVAPEAAPAPRGLGADEVRRALERRLGLEPEAPEAAAARAAPEAEAPPARPPDEVPTEPRPVVGEEVAPTPGARKRIEAGSTVQRVDKPGAPLGRALHFDRGRNAWRVLVADPKGGKPKKQWWDRAKIKSYEEPPAGVTVTRTATGTEFTREGLEQVDYRDLRSVADQIGAPQAKTKSELIDNVLRTQAEGAGPPARPPETPPGAPPPDLPPEGLPHKLRKSKMQGDAIEKLKHVLGASKRLKGEQRKIAHQRLLAGVARAQAAEAAAVEKVGAGPYEPLYALKGGLKGERAVPLIGYGDSVPGAAFSDAEKRALVGALRDTYSGRTLDRMKALEALHMLLEEGRPLALHQQRLLEPLIPRDTLQKIMGRLDIYKEALVVFNLQRLFQVGVGDISWLLRQGLLATAFPKEFALGARNGIGALFSKRYRAQVARFIVNDPDFDALDRMKLDLEAAKLYAGRAGKGVVTEEQFLPETTEETYIGRGLMRLPIFGPTVERTAGSFGMGMASIRYYIGKQTLRNMRKLGKSDDAIEAGLKVVNAITGRGNLGGLERHGALLNQILYSARLLAARVQIPFYLFHKDSYVRYLAARSLLGAAGFVGGTLYLANLAGADIEVDPRSANFGKVKVGPTRLDITGGFGPLVRFAARVGTEAAGGKGVKTDIGTFKDIDVRNAMQQFLESKLSPGVGTVADIWAGENFEGKPLHADWDTFKSEIADRMTPLFIDSLREAVKEGGWPHAPFALAELVGLGSMSYTPAGQRLADMVAEDIEGGTIDLDTYPEPPQLPSDLTPKDRNEFNKRWADEIAEIEGEFGQFEPTAESVAFETAEEIETEAVDKMSRAADNAAETGDYATFRDVADDLSTQRRYQRDVIDRLLTAAGVGEEEVPDETQPQVIRDLYNYGQVFDRYPDADIDQEEREDMFDELERFRKSIGPSRARELDENTKVGLKDIPLYKQLLDDKRVLEDSGYFDRRDASWERVREQAERRGVPLPDDVDVYIRELTRGLSIEDQDRALDRDRWLKRQRRYSERELRDWSRDNPEALYIAVLWGYKDMSDADRRVLRRAGLLER